MAVNDELNNERAPAEETDRPLRLLDEAVYDLVRGSLDELYQQNQGVPLFPTLESFNAPITTVAGRQVLNFAGYNYLGLASHADVLAAAHEAVDRYGTSAGGSRLVSGQNPIHVALETALADFLGVDAALVFVSGHATNESVIGHLMGPEDVVFVDELSHNSILQGVALSGARMLPFPHNNARRCERLVARSRNRFRRALIIIEGLYSMDGDAPDAAAFAQAARNHDAALMIDEAHSFGVLAHGRGITQHSGVDPREVDLLMGTLSKSLASCGGFVAGDARLIEYLRYTTPGFVFSVAPPPASAAAALAALDIIRSGRAPFEQLYERCGVFHDAAAELGIPVHGSRFAPIATVPISSRSGCATIASQLFEAGTLVQPVIYPAVSRGAERLRFFITAAHTDDQIQRALQQTSAFLESADLVP